MRFTLTLLISLLLTSCFAPAYAQVLCPKYTDEQLDRIYAAYDYGKIHGYELTLPAIVISEAFVGNSIVRYNPNDPSTGITQIQFKTLKHLSGLNRYQAAREAERLLVDDELAFYYAISKLNSIKSDSYWYKWKRYNGQGSKAVKYAHNIGFITKQLQFCLALAPREYPYGMVTQDIRYKNYFTSRVTITP